MPVLSDPFETPPSRNNLPRGRTGTDPVSCDAPLRVKTAGIANDYYGVLKAHEVRTFDERFARLDLAALWSELYPC